MDTKMSHVGAEHDRLLQHLKSQHQREILQLKAEHERTIRQKSGVVKICFPSLQLKQVSIW